MDVIIQRCDITHAASSPGLGTAVRACYSEGEKTQLNYERPFI